MLSGLLLVGPEQAAEIYLNELPSLAQGQNTGLKPGEERRSIETSANPLGGEPMRSVLTLKLASADAATGKARVLKTEAYEPESVRNMIAEGARRIAASEGKDANAVAERVRTLMQSIKVVRDEHTELNVENGMTRSITTDTNTNSAGLGVTLVKHEVKSITVTPLR
jgi:hypothetical protein